MPTFTDDVAAIRALVARLTTVFGTGGTYAADFTNYGGVDVKLIQDESDEVEHIGKPMILIQLESGQRSAWSSARSEYREVVAGLTVMATDSSGAQVGTSNPVSSDEKLSIDLIKEFRDSYAAYVGLGLEGVAIEAGALEVVRPDKTVVRKTRHRVRFVYSNS